MEKYTGEEFMKRNIKNFLVKAFSMCLAFILVFPTNLFAMGLDNTKTRKYKASASIMGLAQTDTTSQNDNEVTDQTLLETEITRKETDKYLIEKYAKLSKTTGIIEYIIKVQAKDKKAEDKVTTSFAISKNTDLKDLKIEKISQVHSDKTQTEIKYQEQTPSILYNNDAFETLGVTTDKADLVYYLSAKLTDDALANIDDKSPTMDLDYNIGEDYQDRYALTIDKTEVVGEYGQVDSIIQTLKEKDDSHHQVKAIYKEGNTPDENPKEITWTDFIHTIDDKEFTYDINVDDGQDATDSFIKVEFYQATDRGYILKEDFTKEIPFTESLKIQIPLGFIAKVELKTKATGNAKEYSLNQTKIPNPIYKEEKTEEKSEEEDADPLPEESPNTEEAKDTDKEKIIPIDPETNEAVIDHSLVKEDTKEESEPAREETSAIDLNRDSVISNFKNKDKLNPLVEITINNISSLFNSYNNDEISYEEFIANLKSQAGDISKEDFTAIVEGLIAGLNQDTYKVANIDEDQLLAEIYGKDESEEAKPATEEKPVTETKEADKKETSNVETDNVETDTNNLDTEAKEDFRTPEEKIKDNALESFDKSLSQAKEASKKPQEDDRSFVDNLSEGFKGIFGQSKLQKADKELKAALVAGKSLEEIQALLLDLGKKYELNSKDEAKLMSDNEDAIKGLIARDADQNFRPSMLMAKANENADPLDSKKFTIRTRFDTSTAVGPIRAGQYFNIHLDKKLTVKEGTTLDPIKYNGEVIANPKYNPTNNTIVYTIAKDITENIQVPLNIDVDYKTPITLDEDGNFTVVNSVSGLGVTDPKSLLPERIDKNGNPAGSIIEPGRDDVIKIIEPDDSNYKVDTDAYAIPVINDGKLQGYNWTIKVSSDTDLNALGLKVNFTEVVGSGLGEFQNSNVELTDQLQGAFGIHDSKHHAPKAGIKEITYNFYTPVQGMQEKYMMDISIILTEKGKVGAKRFVMDGWPADKVKEATPIRSGMNNRTTVLGEFTSESAAKWTVTDAVSTGDTGTKEDPDDTKLPWEKRSLSNNQTLQKGQVAVYKIDTKTGKMVQDGATEVVSEVPDQGTNPNTNQAVGTIAVYGYDTSFEETEKNPLSLAGVEISKCQDIYVDQNWNLDEGLSMPAQTIKAVDPSTNAVLGTTGENGVPEQSVQQGAAATRSITIPNVKVWNIQGERKFTKTQPKIVQTFPTDKTYNGQTISYYENHNYYDPNTKGYNIHNRGTVENVPKMASFTIVKTDKKDPKKKLAGARFKLLGGPEVITDANGEAVFNNIAPGTYTIFETKAPNGYKSNQENATINIDKEGRVSLEGGPASISAGSNPTQTVEHGGYPDYMNAMQYATKDDKRNVTTYIFLKANEAQRGGSTDRDTRLNLRMDNGSITKVEVFDVYPSSQRNPLKTAMTQQTADKMVSELGTSVLNSPHESPIKGSENVYDQFLEKTGYQITFPKERFTRDWGFLVKVTGTGDSLTYDWLTDKDTGNQAKLQDQKIVPSTSNDTDKATKITITNEAFETLPVEVTKLEKVKNADDKEETKPIAGATFVIKDENGDVISTITSGKDGKVSFGKMPGGKYTIEETQAPEGYVKSNVVFDVTVDGSSQATYKPRFKNGSGYPVKGQDYLIKDMEQGQDDSRAKVTSVEQKLYVNDKESGSIGRRPGIWEAYFLESLSYTAKINLENSAPGTRFSIQFDPNLDFTQYFSEFPKIIKDGKEIADPYFDYTTNKLTYVFNKNSNGGQATANIKLVGMIPSKYFAQNDGIYNFTVTVAPGQDSFDNQTITQPIVADYNLYYYDPARAKPSQTYYFRDVYKADDGNWYVTALAYYNPDYVHSGSKDVLNFNWKAVKHYTAGNYVKWKGDGTTPPYDLTDVKIYQTPPKMGVIDLPEIHTSKKVNYNMPLSFGVRPEQDPSTYHLIYSRSINPNEKITNDRNGDVVLNYDPSKLNTWGMLEDKGPLNIQMPSVNNKNKDGYIIEQTFKISDIDKFNNTWRAFNMSNGPFNSAFVSKANANIAIGDQTGGEIPKFYSQEVGLFNKKYEPGKFSILKQDETNNKALSNATFSLTDEDNNVIYRSSGADGIVNFENLKPGSYTLKEEIPPKDFVKTDRRWNVNVSIDGSVTITEIGLNASGETLHGKDIKIPVGNKPTATKFTVYKKDDQNQPLAGAEFKLTKQGETTAFATGKSGNDGVVSFDKKLTTGTYILEETNAPEGYQKLNQKWVVEVDGNNNVKVYNYNEKQDDPSGSTTQFENSLLTQDGVNWVNVSQRPTNRFISGDNRQTGYADKSITPYKLGTRIVGINKTKKYAIQRYVINPEGKDIDIYNAIIHREKLWDENMPWYKGDEAINIYTLDKPVTTNVEDIRLYSYNYTDITDKVEKSPLAHSYSDRLQLVFNKDKLKDTDDNSLIKGKPIIVDVKIPYNNEYGGVGTGMDLNTSVGPSWKSDYYELVSDIVVGDPIKKDNITEDIKGSYISDDYLDVTNEKKRYEFSIDKVNQDKNPDGGHDAVTGATFKLVGPKPSEDTKWTKSDENGKVSFKNLVPGIYDLIETGPAQGYEQSNTNWQVAVLKDGKIYIRDNNTNENTGESTSKEKTAKLLVDYKDATSTYSLGIGDELVSSPVSAGDGWEEIDPSITTGGSSSKLLAADNGAPVTTKITEINKSSKRFRQEFVYSPAPNNNGLTERSIEIHREPANYDLTNTDTDIKVYQNVNGDNKDITSSVSFEESVSLNESESPSKPVGKIVAEIPATIKGTLTVKVETSYDPNYGVGLATDYDSNVGAIGSHKSWIAYFYTHESKINKETTNNTNGYSSTSGSVTDSSTSSETDPLDNFTPVEGKDILITDGTTTNPVQITNKKDGITPKVIKTDRYGNKLQGATFNIKKMKDDKYDKVDDTFKVLKGTSDKDGNITFKDEDGKVVKLQKGYYVMTEEKSPDGYKRITAPWNMEVKDDGGRMYSVYKGPTDTPSSFIDDNKKANAKTYGGNDIKVKSRLTYINPESKTFVQRIYIDTRNYNGGEFLNVQISPKYKREEIDRPGLPPVTIKEGVKTAYRTTYQLVNPEENPDIEKGNYDKILRTYDLANSNMSMVNTARWRPFDWGFDEDQLNIGKGVYIVEVEGYYDDTIIDGRATNEVYIDDNYNFTDAKGNLSKEPVKKAPYKKTKDQMNPADYGKIDLHVDFYKGKREFEQLVYSKEDGGFNYETVIGETGKNTASYQGGAEALRKYLEETKGKETADAWAKKKPAGQKYANFISKKVTFSNGDYITGKVDPSVAGDPYHHADTSVNLNPIYSSDTENEVPKDGLVIENEKEKYNITFSKHGRDNPDDKADSQAVTENRLEGAVFKIQKLIGGNYEDVKGSTVASAFNGYFGFRNLEPGRYRLMEVQAPKGYRPITEPLLSFTIETIKTDSGKIVDPETGKIIDIKTINVKFPGDTNAQALTSLYMADPKDSTNKTQIKNVDSKEINMETIIYKSTDATSGKPLKELILVVSDGHEYALLQTKIISDSSGFVSLEYEGANGVYQYVPEKSTTKENGKLVDFVTSATAKNMGKIINEKPGKGSITINKKDGEGNALEGANFKLTRILENGTGTQTVVNYNATSNADGKVEFTGLPIGNYELVETKSVDGYQNKGQIWHFTVGGEGLDPYSGPIARTGVNLTNYITLKESKMEIIRPDNDPDKQTENTIWPNSAQLFRFKNDFELNDGKIIRPGDYFQVKLSDYTDLYGIYNKDLVSGLDIFADGVGTIAKAEYDDAREIITYTFTEYARTYELTDFNTSIVSHIDRFKFTTSQDNVPVGLKMYGDNTDSTFKKVNVRFDLGTHFAQAHGTRPNLSSKITYFDTKSGEFEHIFYINRDQDLINDGRFTYLPDKDVENLRMQVFRVYDKHLNNNQYSEYNKNIILPPSYAVDVNDFVNKGYIYLLNGHTYSNETMNKDNPAVYTFPNGYLQPEDTYIIRVTGSIKDKTDTADYEAQGKIDRYNEYNVPYMGAERHDYVYGLLNENNAEAKLEITATNPKNEISFKKVDSEGRVLKGAKFALVKQDGENWTEVKGTEKTTEEDGLVKYEKLAPGKYALIEKEAPAGYNKIEGHIEEFTVDKDGIITKEVTRPKGSDNPVGSSTDGTQPDTPKPGTGTTTPSLTENVLNTVTEVLGNVADKVTGGETETVNEPIGTDPINVVNYKNIEFVKVDGDDNSKKLQGAVFEIHYKEKEDGEYAALTKKVTEEGKEVDKPITVTSGKDGKFKLPISKDGYYALVETKAPEGYGKFPGKIKEFKLESGSVSVLEKDPLKSSLTRGKKGQITSQVLSVDKDKKTFTQRIVINPKHESLTGINDYSYLRILENGWSITPKSTGSVGGGQIKVALLKENPDTEKGEKKSIGELTEEDFKQYNPVEYGITGSNNGSRYSLKSILGNASETTDTIVVEYTGTLASETTEVDQKAELIIDNTILDNADYSLDISTLSSKEPIYVDVNKSNITPIEVENKKSTFPLTGGNGVFTGFAIIGTAVMLLALAYFGIYQNDKNRRRSARYKK